MTASQGAALLALAAAAVLALALAVSTAPGPDRICNHDRVGCVNP